MGKALPRITALLPLPVTAAAFKWFPNSQMLGPVLIGSVLLGWIGLGFSGIQRVWLKVLLLVIYPFVMWIAGTVLMVLVYGVPGL